jgi:hypothetical protein
MSRIIYSLAAEVTLRSLPDAVLARRPTDLRGIHPNGQRPLPLLGALARRYPVPNVFALQLNRRLGGGTCTPS